MRSEVPDDVDVVLEEAEVDAGGVVIIKLAENALVDHLANFADGAGEEEGVIDHDLQLFGGGEIDELGGLGRGRGEGLFDEDVFAVFEGGFGELEVGPDGVMTAMAAMWGERRTSEASPVTWTPG